MGRANSWLVLEADGVPASTVAARTLRQRLDTVWNELRAACEDPHDPDRVHDLRVATRRSLAALDVFEDLLPPRRRSWLARSLRRLRRAAGDARDLDVLAARLDGRPGPVCPPRPPTRSARERLIAMLARQRVVSRQPIREFRERMLTSDWTARVESLLERLSRDGQRTTFRSYARKRFPPLVDRFFDRADRRLRNADEIHRLRIEGKRLRYAVEIFASVISAAERDRCQQSLSQLQTTLGEFTDHASAAERFRRLARDREIGADRGMIATLRRREERLARRARKAFVKWWTPTRRRSLRRSFASSLSRRSA